ncbi:MAG: hypothetical protein K0V04_44885 [Deltaproteobacteria bacterium]|nr:hypothetical protein [Deltaproteobacteria bacterium]
MARRWGRRRGRRLLVRGGAALVGLGVLLDAGLASASNTGMPRVPPSFLGTRCIETVDRGVSAQWGFDLGIPFEDTMLTADEPTDSRTFQFFALCRQPSPLEVLPQWISASDAVTASMFDATIEIPAAGESLDEHPAWVGCVLPITTAAQRMPISCEATMPGASWDTTGVPAGAYAMWGYTYEPALNVWTPRDGVVRVIDGDDASAGPAVSISWPLSEVTAGLDAGVLVAGCVAGMEGTTVELAWATAVALASNGDAAWQPFAQIDDATDTFERSFVPPPEAEYEAVFLRAMATDPQGRSFASYTRERVVFLAGCDVPEGGDRSLPDFCQVGSGSPVVPAGDHVGDGCEPGAADETGTSEGLDSGTSSGDTGGTGSAGAVDDGDQGCGCHTRTTGIPHISWLWVVVCAWRRRPLGQCAVIERQ